MDQDKLLISAQCDKAMEILQEKSPFDLSEDETSGYFVALFTTCFTDLLNEAKAMYEKDRKEVPNDVTINKIIDILSSMRSPEAQKTATQRTSSHMTINSGTRLKIATLDENGKQIDGRANNGYNQFTNYVKNCYNKDKKRGEKLGPKDYSILWSRIKELTDVRDEDTWNRVILNYVNNK
jgi:hypothetical protein